MPKVTVFIASRTEQENYLLESKLKPLESAELKFASVHPAGLPLAVDRMTAAVIMNLGDWTPKDAIAIQELRRAGYRAPILVSAKADPAAVNKEIRAMSDVIFLPKPFDTRDLIGIVSKMLTTRGVSQQKFKRFPTMQEAEVEVAGARLASRVRNLSKGGAFLEFLTPTSLKVGEYVSLTLELKDLRRTYTFPAKIVWTSRSGQRGAGIGVEFTGRGDVQRSILGG